MAKCLRALARFKKKWTIRLFLFSHSGGGLQWFAMVCGAGGVPAASLVSLHIVPNSGGDLWWFAIR